MYLDAWLDDPLAKRMIKSVDKSEVLGERLIRSKALGLIPPTDLSGGVKTLLLIYNMPDKVFNALERNGAASDIELLCDE